MTPSYLVWLRSQPCAKCGAETYYNSGHIVEGTDDPEYAAVSVCVDCHREIHTLTAKRSIWPEGRLQNIITSLKDKFLSE